MIDPERVLVGAGWITADAAWQQFACFPEVIFCDATHKTNNEGRPLLVVVGRDSNAAAFCILRIFMPNETSAFYRWVFMKCIIPSFLVGEEQLKRVRLLITDGDSQEFNAASRRGNIPSFSKCKKNPVCLPSGSKDLGKQSPTSITPRSSCCSFVPCHKVMGIQLDEW